jgi:hypothetical protein
MGTPVVPSSLAMSEMLLISVTPLVLALRSNKNGSNILWPTLGPANMLSLPVSPTREMSMCSSTNELAPLPVIKLARRHRFGSAVSRVRMRHALNPARSRMNRDLTRHGILFCVSDAHNTVDHRPSGSESRNNYRTRFATTSDCVMYLHQHTHTMPPYIPHRQFPPRRDDSLRFLLLLRHIQEQHPPPHPKDSQRYGECACSALALACVRQCNMVC